MLLPLQRAGAAGEVTEPLDGDELERAFLGAEERSSGERHSNAQGILQALRAIFPRVPADKRERWFQTVSTVCSSMVRLHGIISFPRRGLER